MPALAADSSGRSPMLVPAGWTVGVQNQGQLAFLHIDERPGAPDSPQLAMISLPLASGATPQAVVQQVAAQFTGVQVLAQQALPGGGLFVVVAGKIGEIPAKAAIMGTSDGNNAYAAFFVAPTHRFDDLGGTGLLLASLQMNALPSAPVASAPTSPMGGMAAAPDVVSYEGQLAMLASRQKVDPKLLVGSWSHGTSAPMGDVYREVTSGSLSYDAIGHGDMMQFNDDGTYAYIYSYSQTYGGCQNTIQRQESGSYQFDGMTLTLQPKGFEANLCTCCAGRPTVKRENRPKVRRYEVALHPGGRHMVIRGTCPEYTISCVGPDGNQFQREGFVKR